MIDIDNYFNHSEGMKIINSYEAIRDNIDLLSATVQVDENGLAHDKYGGTQYQDYAITRKDGSKVILRELSSELEGLHKYMIKYDLYSSPNNNNSIICYSEGIDLKTAYSNQLYFNALQSLIDENRIQDRLNIATSNGCDTLYLGGITYENNKYRKSRDPHTEAVLYQYLRNQNMNKNLPVPQPEEKKGLLSWVKKQWKKVKNVFSKSSKSSPEHEQTAYDPNKAYRDDSRLSPEQLSPLVQKSNDMDYEHQSQQYTHNNDNDELSL